ncbi:MAG TPA: hypothetical protein DF603_04800 [Chryseobacterium sp.]|nr:hypothetical protein [Chryseobacterium sp.]
MTNPKRVIIIGIRYFKSACVVSAKAYPYISKVILIKNRLNYIKIGPHKNVKAHLYILNMNKILMSN